MNIYVGNVPYAATETDLEELFQEYGQVANATIIRDRFDGRSKGFGFVEMENQEDGERAIAALDGQEMMGRPLKVNLARENQQRGTRRQDSRRQSKSAFNRTESSSSAQRTGGSKPATHFHNPYTFIPTPPRPAHGFAGDFNPLDKGLTHDSLKDRLWTGHISIKLTTVTPLVLLKDDGRERKPKEHQTYDVLDYIPESSLRGMLRSAYEVVTNSRYACFRNNDPLAYRMGWDKKEYEKSPNDLLDCSLKPAKTLCELSPADRLFGWVLQKQEQDSKSEVEAGYKSRIRVICEDGTRPNIVKDFGGKTLPLTILGEPKPAQGRFYVAADNLGTPQENGLNKDEAGYSSGRGLRGRKWYWHDKGLVASEAREYWKPSVEDRTHVKRNNRYQEYRRPNGRNGKPQIDPQNRSITGWIKPGSVFKASLYVQNLQPQEVGALLWLLARPDTHHFRLGYGKPLGFGSVRIELDCPNEALPLGKGEDWKEYYTALDQSSPATLNADEQKDCIQKFWDSMIDGYPAKEDTRTEKRKEREEKFKSLNFIAGFLRVLQGPGDNAPIHYPRLEYPKRGEYKPDPGGKNFEWFVANDDNRHGKKLALPAVTEEKGLPYYPPKR